MRRRRVSARFCCIAYCAPSTTAAPRDSCPACAETSLSGLAVERTHRYRHQPPQDGDGDFPAWTKPEEPVRSIQQAGAIWRVPYALPSRAISLCSFCLDLCSASRSCALRTRRCSAFSSSNVGWCGRACGRSLAAFQRPEYVAGVAHRRRGWLLRLARPTGMDQIADRIADQAGNEQRLKRIFLNIAG